MPRIARVVGVGLPHHITQRGNNKQNTFWEDDDRERYLSWVLEYSGKFDLLILAYCLMSNHVHFIAVPNNETSMAQTFNTAHMRYSQYFNRKTGATGHLWQGRFYSCVLDQLHLISAAKYVERNPVRAGIAVKPWDWKWSSNIENIKTGKAARLFEFIDMTPDAWKKYTDSTDATSDLEHLRKCSATGRPLGDFKFIDKLETEFGKRLHALPRGRPTK